MEVKVIVEKWGRYNLGDVIDLPESTALACAKAGKVEVSGGDKEHIVKPKNTKKK